MTTLISLDKQTYLDQILRIVCNVFDAHSTVLFLQFGEDQYRINSFFSLSDSIRKDVILTTGTGLTGWVIRNNKPLLINNFDRAKGHLGYYAAGEESEIRAFMGCPLDQGLGVLCLDSKRTYSFSDKDQKILHQFVGLVDTLIAEFKHLTAGCTEQRFYQGLKLLCELHDKFSSWLAYLTSFLDLLSGVTGFSHCFLAVCDAQGKFFSVESSNKELVLGVDELNKQFTMENGLIGWVFRNGAPIFASKKDLSSPSASLLGPGVPLPDFVSVACMPVAIHKRTRGVIVLASVTPQSTGRELRAFLKIVASNLSIFLENLYLRNRLTCSGG